MEAGQDGGAAKKKKKILKTRFPLASIGFSIPVMLTLRGCVETAMRDAPCGRDDSQLSLCGRDILSQGSLPSKPLQKYAAAGQAVTSLHTMAVLQAYQADLLKDLDKGQGLSPDEGPGLSPNNTGVLAHLRLGTEMGTEG